MSVEVAKKFRILVVEDQDVVRECIMMLLLHEGHEVRTADNGERAMALFEQERFDLVFTDYQMPEMRGDELALAIKARVPGEPVVMVTAEADAFRASGRLPPGVDFMVSKPFSISDLREAISQVTGEKSLAA